MSTFKLKLAKLENVPESIRNVCILAHIDHGKTSLSDCMLASNGIISQHHQGEIRYLDSRPDEQERGITMESSTISLYARTAEREYVVNLIDSPGHVDFSSEVTQASRLCDGAIVLVDALEGVCSQTVSALRQAWDEELQSILVINKIDKLYEDWQMTASEATAHLVKLLEQVNAVWGQFYVGKRMETEEDNDEIVYFSPSSDNVVFCSALHGWGFTIKQFAHIFEKKIGVDKLKLVKFLWGDYYLDPKTKKVLSGVTSGTTSKRKSMFTQFIMENVWAVYEAAKYSDTEKIEKITKALNLKPVTDPTNAKQIFHQWIPLPRAIYGGIFSLPSPDVAQSRRLNCILRNTPNPELIDNRLHSSMKSADPEGPQLAYVSKVVSVNASDILGAIGTAKPPVQSVRVDTEPNSNPVSNIESTVLGLSRIYSGTFTVGMEVDLLSPRYDPKDPLANRSRITITGIFLFMGRDLIPVSKAGPGVIVGFSGLDGHIIKSGTLCQSGQIVAPNLARSANIAAPILRVAIEPSLPTKLDEVEHGLELLNAADPSVEFTISDRGEFILATAGELHLERCLYDLEEKYAKVKLDVSEPVVPFRETIQEPFSGEGPVEVNIGGCYLLIEVRPLTGKDLESQSLVCKVGENVLLDLTTDQTVNSGKFGAQSVITGFKSAMIRGPLIQEPVQGVAVLIHQLVNTSEKSNIIGQRRLISATVRAITDSLKQWSPRIMLAMYRCDIQASTEALGRVYGVITRRKGRVILEELKEGTPFFLVRALIPVVESIGFSEEIRKRTSGAANPQLMFDGFELLDENPFWVPTTDEEIEDLGEIADKENIALNYVKQIRKRKGLAIGEKLVDGAERDRSRRH